MSRCAPAFQNVVPPLVFVCRDPHVIRNGVEDVRQAVLFQGVDPSEVVRLAANLRVQGTVIDDIVPVGAAGDRLEVWRGVAVRDAQQSEVRNDLRGIPKGKSRVKLEAVGGFGKAACAASCRAACSIKLSASLFMKFACCRGNAIGAAGVNDYPEVLDHRASGSFAARIS